jgi:hypothetical protein
MTTVYRNAEGQAVRFDDQANASMRLLEVLINAGDLVLAPDRWVEGALRFTPTGRLREEPAVISSSTGSGKLLTITLPNHLSAARRTELAAVYQEAADHCGARLLLLDGGATASLGT